MDEQRIASAVLSSLNDDLAVTPYAHGYLVSLPLFFFDDDRVKLFVEPFERGVRVSDRGLTAMRLVMSDVNVDSDRIGKAIARSSSSALCQFDAHEGEIVAFGGEKDLADLIFGVGSAAIRLDQLRWMARERRPGTFREQVVDRLIEAVGGRENFITPNDTVRLRSGRTKQVTASVHKDKGGLFDVEHVVYVQALSGASREAREAAVDRCYHLFHLAEVNQEKLVAVASGSESDWPQPLIAEMSEVSTVAFFDDPGRLSKLISDKVLVNATTATQEKA